MDTEYYEKLEHQIRMARTWNIIRELCYDYFEDKEYDKIWIWYGYGDYSFNIVSETGGRHYSAHLRDNGKDFYNKGGKYYENYKNIHLDILYFAQNAPQENGYGIWERDKPYKYPELNSDKYLELRSGEYMNTLMSFLAQISVDLAACSTDNERRQYALDLIDNIDNIEKDLFDLY